MSRKQWQNPVVLLIAAGLAPSLLGQTFQIKHNTQPGWPRLAESDEATSRFIGDPLFSPVAIASDADGSTYITGTYSNNFNTVTTLYKLNPEFE